MGYHAYLDQFHTKESKVKDIKESITNSKEFVNIFLGCTNNKSNEDKDELFNEVLERIADTLVESD